MNNQKLRARKSVTYYDVAYIAQQTGLSQATIKKYAQLKKQPMRDKSFLWTYLEVIQFLAWLRITFPHRIKKTV